MDIGASVRRLRRRLPKRVRVLGLRLLRGVGLWSPAAPPAPRASAPAKPAPTAKPAPAARPPARRSFELSVPLLPLDATEIADEVGVLRTLHIDVPMGMYVAEVLQEKTLAGYEPFALAAFLTATEQAPGGAVLDIGANIGIYALLAAMVGDRPVRAVEPTPDLAEAARILSVANDLPITVDELALGDAEGSATLYLSDVTDSSNSLNPGFRPHSREIEVPLETVDTYVRRTGAVPAVMKIDTETTEHQVVAGAAETIAAHRPWMFVEVLYGRSEQELRAALAPHGYTAYHLTGPGPLPEVAVIEGDPTGKHFMFLLAPEPVGDHFWRRMNAWQSALERVDHPRGQVSAGPGARLG